MKVGLAKHQLQLFGNFLELHCQQLKIINSNFENCGGQTSDHIFDQKHEIHFAEMDVFFKKPVTVNYQCGKAELMNQFKIIDSNNKMFVKVINTFYSLQSNLEEFNLICDRFQGEFLKYDWQLGELQHNEHKSMNVELIMEIDESMRPPHNNLYSSNAEAVFIRMSECMDFLCIMQSFVNAGVQAMINLLQQLISFHSFDKNHFGLGFQHNEICTLIELFILNLVKFDEILSKSNFRFLWLPYKRTITRKFQQEQSLSQPNDKYYSENQKIGLLRILNELEFFLGGLIFQSFLENTNFIKNNKIKNCLYSLINSFNNYIKESLQQVKKYPAEICDESETVKLIGINVFVVFQHRFCGQMDQKIVKQLLEVNLKFVGVNLIGKYIWNPDVFLKQHAETLLVAGHFKYVQEQEVSKKLYLQKKTDQLKKIVRKYWIETTMWVLKCKMSMASGYSNLKIGQFESLCIQFLQGAQCAGQMNYICKSIFNLHQHLQLSMDSQTITHLSKLFTMIKLVHIQLSADVERIAKIIKSVIDCLQYKCLHIIISSKKKLSAKTLCNEIVDIFSALKIIEKTLNGPPTAQRMFIINFLIQSNNLQSHITLENFGKLQKSLRRLKFLSRFQSNIYKICDLSYIAWSNSLYGNCVLETIGQHILPHYISMICNISLASEKFKNLSNEVLNAHIVCKLCGQIETFLRIEAHSSLQRRINPFELNNENERQVNDSLLEITNSFEDGRPQLKLNVLNLNDMFVSFKYHIENYLSCMFYNLTTINLNDWKAYEVMRNLAKSKLNLNPITDLLPNQSLEQGKDALEIMRNIHIFVTQYNYNMNNQYFVENNCKRNKYLNTISIGHVANSLQTHGTGFINTAVNFSYQFLRSKLYTISQFLYDEQIHSRLLKEHCFYIDMKFENLNDCKSTGAAATASSYCLNKNINYIASQSQFIYKYERAEELNKELRALGISSSGSYYMDEFRQLITEVGNTMGYIRLIRCGHIHANYIESSYLPPQISSLGNFDFEKLCFKDGTRPTDDYLLSAAQNLDKNLENYSDKDELDFFKLLTNAFKPFFRSSNNQHLKKLFLIIPALIINYVDYILNAREKLTKYNRDDAMVMFDDGFAMGLVCLLKILNQFNQFESLYWFKSIDLKFREEQQMKMTEIQIEMKKNQKDQSLLQTLALVEKRITAKYREFSLLRDGIYSAKIFFQ